MRDQPAVFEDGEDFLGEGGKVIRVTLVSHDSIFEVGRESVTLSIAPIPSSSSITGRPLLIALRKKMREKDLALLTPPRP